MVVVVVSIGYQYKDISVLWSFVTTAVIFVYWLMCDLHLMPSVLWRCWLGGRKGIRPVKNWVVGCWRGVCLEQGADLHMAQLMPLPLTVSCFSKIQIGFTFLVPAHLDSPGKRAIKWVCVCVCEIYISESCVLVTSGLRSPSTNVLIVS